MDAEKIKLGVYQHLPKLLKCVKAGAIEREMNEYNGWISVRLNHAFNGRKGVRKFYAHEVDKLNQAIWQLADKLMNTNIEYSEDRTLCAQNVKQAFNSLLMMQVVSDKLGWKSNYIAMRTTLGKDCHKRPKFSEADVQQATLCIRQIGMYMHSIEYYLDQE